jgi:glycosyltransferase involved in cell wall biosynthesis
VGRPGSSQAVPTLDPIAPVGVSAFPAPPASATSSYSRSARGGPIERGHVIVRTAFVSTYPPRQCGIATFTHDLAAATGSREIVALHNPGLAAPYPIEVHHRIRRGERADYAHAARALDDCVDVVSIQHDYGIWGGEDGGHVLDFVRDLSVPAVATLHTVLDRPSDHQRAILTDLVASVDATVVMSKPAAALLAKAYGADPDRVSVIPHGVPDLPLVDPVALKPGLDVEGRKVILSFGLLRRAKGFEQVLDALPQIVAAHPSALYVVVGATHPDVLLAEGDAYREALLAQVRRLGMGKHVRFVDRFVGRVELTRWLQAADVVATPYTDLDQTVSGTLAYAMGAGRAIVSTPFGYATDQLAGRRGILVPGSPADLATAINNVLGDDRLRADIGRRAYASSRGMVWSAVAAQYGRLFEQVAATTRLQVRSAPMMVVGASAN